MKGQELDVAVVGASMAGLMAATHLPKNLNIAIFDPRKTIGYPFRCSGFINKKSFDEFNLPKRAIQNGIRFLRVVHCNQHILFDTEGIAGYVTERPMIEEELVAGIEKNGVDVRLGEGVKEIDGNSISTRKGIYSAKYIIGADGAGSIVRNSLGIKNPSTTLAVQYEFEGEFEPGEAIIHVAEESMPYHLWVIPINEHVARIGKRR